MKHSPAAVPHIKVHERHECHTVLPANPNNGEVRGNTRPILMLTGFVSVPITHLLFQGTWPHRLEQSNQPQTSTVADVNPPSFCPMQTLAAPRHHYIPYSMPVVWLLPVSPSQTSRQQGIFRDISLPCLLPQRG